MLLETEWVLHFAYGLTPDAIQQGLRLLLGMENVQVRDAFAVKQAVDWLGGNELCQCLALGF